MGGLGKTIVCITKVGEYVTGMCTLWVFWFWGKREVDEQ